MKKLLLASCFVLAFSAIAILIEAPKKAGANQARARAKADCNLPNGDARVYFLKKAPTVEENSLHVQLVPQDGASPIERSVLLDHKEIQKWRAMTQGHYYVLKYSEECLAGQADNRTSYESPQEVEYEP